MRRVAARPPNEKGGACQDAAPISNQLDNHQHNEGEAQKQLAARVIARRHFLRASIAGIIAGELGLGGAR